MANATCGAEAVPLPGPSGEAVPERDDDGSTAREAGLARAMAAHPSARFRSADRARVTVTAEADPDGRTSRDEMWDAYGRAVVDLFPPGRRPLRLRADTEGLVGEWPEELSEPVVVLTAWNPSSQPLAIVANRARQRSLLGDLAALGHPCWPAVGWDPASAHREESVAVSGLTEGPARALGRRYGQEALYLWTRRAWEIVACGDGRRARLGWSLEEPAEPVSRSLPS